MTAETSRDPFAEAAGFKTMGQVLRWVVTETDAMCPSEERLRRFRADRDSAEFSDLRYHVLEAACPFCRAELQLPALAADVGHVSNVPVPIQPGTLETCPTSAAPLHPDAARLEAEFSAVLVQEQNDITKQFGRAFPRLSADMDDVLQETVLEILQKIRIEGFCPRMGWAKYLRWLLPLRLRDRLRVRQRQQELQLFEELAVQASAEAARQSPLQDSASSPSSLVINPTGERRQRQAQLFSDVLRDFVRFHESPALGTSDKLRRARLRQKEIYERQMRDPSAMSKEVAALMGIPENTFASDRKKCVEWVLAHALSSDLNHTVLATLRAGHR